MKVQFYTHTQSWWFKGLLPLMACVLLFTCQKEEEPLQEQQISLDVEAVKQAFSSQFNKKAFSNITNEPLWEHALSYQKNNISYIEVPFRNIDEFNLELSTSISMDRLMASIDNNGNLSLNIVHYYAKDINTFLPDFNQLNYVNPVRFNGYVTLYDMDKNQIEVNRYKDGILSKGSYDIVKKKDRNSIDNLRVDEGCEMETETTIIKHSWFWIYSDGSTETISTYYEYIETQYEVCDGESSGGAGGGSSVINVETYANIINNLTGKALCVFNKMVTQGLVSEALSKFNDGTGTPSITFEVGDLADNTRAQTSWPDGNDNIVITLNNDNSYKSVGFNPNIFVANTIIHEVIHAEFLRQIISAIGNNQISNLTEEEAINLLENGDHHIIYEYYRNTKDWSHNYMADHYRDTFARVTQEFDTGIPVPDNQQPQQLYLDTAWLGLMNFPGDDSPAIIAFDNLPNSEKNRIISVINQQIENNANQNCEE